MNVKVKKLCPEAIIPKYQTPGSAGFDVHAVLDSENPFYNKIDSRVYTGQGQFSTEVLTNNYIIIPPREQAIVGTGLSFALPEGYEMQIRPRSGLAAKNGISITNSPGTLDSDYRGELKIILVNLGHKHFRIEQGDRIAQCVIAPVLQAGLQEVEEFSQEDMDKDRGGGFGSTGNK